MNMENSQVEEQTTAPTSKDTSIISVRVKQVNLVADSDEIKMWGKSFSLIRLLAIVRALNTNESKSSYLLEDHTGQIYGDYWFDDEHLSECTQIAVNSYALIHGNIVFVNGSSRIVIHKIEAIKSPSRLVTHMLEVLHCRYKTESLYKKAQRDRLMNIEIEQQRKPPKIIDIFEMIDYPGNQLLSE